MKGDITMSLKKGIKILKDRVDKQLEFIEWLKSKGLYDPMESADTMQKMHNVWEAADEGKD
jgi:hypothetical protein